MFERIPRPGHSDLFSLPQIMQRMFEDVEPSARSAAINPPVDILENDTEVRLVLEVAGLDRESMKVTFENHVLTVSGEKNQKLTPPEGAYFRGERRFGRFHRAFTVPTRVDASKIEATYTDGLLSIVMPKTAEAQPRKIEIKAGPPRA